MSWAFALLALARAMTGLILLPRDLQPACNEFDISARGSLTARRFLLERMQHVDDVPEANRVDRPISVAVEIVAHLQHTRPLAFPRFGVRMLAAELGQPQRVADRALAGNGKARKSCFDEPLQSSGF